MEAFIIETYGLLILKLHTCYMHVYFYPKQLHYLILIECNNASLLFCTKHTYQPRILFIETKLSRLKKLPEGVLYGICV